MKRPYHFTFLLVALLIIIQQSGNCQGNGKPPYPIIFIHGYAGNDSTWIKPDGNWRTFFEGLNWQYGGVINVCLEMSTDTIPDPAISDVSCLTSSVSPNKDFYFLNFHNKRDGTLYPGNRFSVQLSSRYSNYISVVTGKKSHLKVGDILATDEGGTTEFMKVKSADTVNNIFEVRRGCFNTPLCDPGIFNPPIWIRDHSNLGNQASAVKQGLGVKLAIDKVKQATGASKVILICHSMGGIAARQYIQNDGFSNHDVAKLLTVDTPHLGSNLSDLSSLFANFLDYDVRSDAARDLRYSIALASAPPNPPYPNSTDNAPFLFGNSENCFWAPYLQFYSRDLNGDGLEGSNLITGLNNKSWPNDVLFHSVISQRSPWCGFVYDDDIVRCDRQYPHPNIIPVALFDTSWHIIQAQLPCVYTLTDPVHNHTHRYLSEVMRGLDEPDNSATAYEIIPNSGYINGFITYQNSLVPSDYDWYKFKADVTGQATFEVGNMPNPNYWVIEIHNQNQTFLTGLNQNSGQNTVSFNVVKDQYYFIWFDSQANSTSWNNPYKFKITTNEILPLLYNGAVNPSQGNTSTNFLFSVYFKDPSNQAPQYVKTIGSGWSLTMNGNGTTYLSGVQFTANNIFSAIGIYPYYFEAKTASGQILRYPASGNFTLNVSQNCTGWEIHVTNLTTSPSYLINGGDVSVTATVHNNSLAPDKIYINVPYTFEMFSPTGTLIDSESGTIPSLAQLASTSITKTLTTSSTQGAYNVVFTLYPSCDNDLSNNSASKTVIVGQAGPSHEFYITSAQAWIEMYPGNIHAYNSHNYKLVSTTNVKVTMQEDSYSSQGINYMYTREYNNSNDILVNEFCDNSSGWLSFGTASTNYVTFDATNITCLPGDIITFVGTCNAEQFQNTDADIYENTTVESWYYNMSFSNNNHKAYWEFNIPSSTAAGQYTFKFGARFAANARFVRTLVITVLTPVPQITSLSKYLLSADDQITITGTKFGTTTGSVKFSNNLNATISSWTNTQIVCKVPNGVQNGDVFVINSGGSSNGMSYQVISSTGDPIIIQPIPDQNMQKSSSLIAATLSNVFWDPNNDPLVYTVTSASSHVVPNITSGILTTTTDAQASGSTMIIVSARDLDNVTVKDTFFINVGSNITGSLKYDNTALTPMDSVWVVLKLNNIPFDSVRANLSGTYAFSGKNSGTYTVTIHTPKPWNGVNATDAIKIQRHFAGLELLTTPVRLNAADVNNSNSINATDAIKVKRRFASLDNSFDRGNWTFAKPTGGDTINVSGSSIVQDFQMLCVGDVNGSYVPGPGKNLENKVIIDNQGSIDVRPLQEFELPIRTKSKLSLSAISLVIPVPTEDFEISSVSFDQPNLVYNITEGELRIAWSELQPLHLKEGETLLTLKLRAKENFTGNQIVELSAGSESELADESGETIPLAELSSLIIKPLNPEGISDNSDAVNSLLIYPNPAKDLLNVEVLLNSSADCSIQITDLLGRDLKIIPSRHFEKGPAKILINTSELSEGTYDLKILVKTNAFIKEMNKKFVINH